MITTDQASQSRLLLYCSFSTNITDGISHCLLCIIIKSTCCLIKKNHICLSINCSCNSNSLSLSTRRRTPLSPTMFSFSFPTLNCLCNLCYLCGFSNPIVVNFSDGIPKAIFSEIVVRRVNILGNMYNICTPSANIFTINSFIVYK